MRIDTYSSSASQLSSELSSQQVNTQNAAQAGQTSQAGGEDRATLSSDTASVGSLVATALSSPEVRQDKVDSLRDAVNGGKYSLDPDRIAQSIVDDFV
jgi:negative regulator of flagellin synthesis FlgM